MYYGTTIEEWQERICYHNKATQTRHVANRGDIIVRARRSGYAGHSLLLTPTGVTEGKRFIGDPNQPFTLRPYAIDGENGIRVDPTARTYVWCKWMWDAATYIYNECLPRDLHWRVEGATRWLSGYTRLHGDYAGPPRNHNNNHLMRFHVPIGGPITVTGGVLTREVDVTPAKVAEMRRIRAALLRIIAPYEVMRLSCSSDHAIFGHAALDPMRTRPLEERHAEVMEMLNDDVLYMAGYQHLVAFTCWRYGPRPPPPSTDEVMDNFMRQLKRRTYTTEVQS